MKAALCTRYGPPEVLQIGEVDTPIPKDNEVRIKIHATTVTSGDVRMRKFDVPPLFWIPFRLAVGVTKLRKPILGFSLAGKIESAGKDVKRFNVGDKVFGSVGFSGGTYAEFKCLPETAVLTLLPDSISYDQAAAIMFGGATSLHFLRKADIQKGQRVLVYGASGSLGTAAVQLANHFGAEVTGVCSTANVELVRSLGADHVIDYKKEDFTEVGETYDVIYDTVGYSPYSWCVRSLKKGGYYLRAVNMTLPTVIRGYWTKLAKGRKVVGGVASEKVEDVEFIKELILNGELTPVIDRTYQLEKIAEAHAYVEKGHKKGNVVITIVGD